MMLHKLTPIITFILLSLFANEVLAQSFEGIVELNTTNSEAKDYSQVKWMLKDGNHKLEVTGTADGKAYKTNIFFLKNNSNVHIITNIDGQTAKYSVPVSSLHTDDNNGIATKTGESKKIMGFISYKYQILTQKGVTTCWVSNNTGLDLKSFPPTLLSKGVIGILAQNGISGVPLEILSRNQAGEIVYSQIVTSISTTSVNDNQFTVPTDAQSGEELFKNSIEVK